MGTSLSRMGPAIDKTHLLGQQSGSSSLANFEERGRRGGGNHLRAMEIANRAKEKGAPDKKFSGFLDTTADWQNKVSHRLARYLTHE
jgi:hypothetical protein